jgi:hypothetical protein
MWTKERCSTKLNTANYKSSSSSGKPTSLDSALSKLMLPNTPEFLGRLCGKASQRIGSNRFGSAPGSAPGRWACALHPTYSGIERGARKVSLVIIRESGRIEHLRRTDKALNCAM